MKKSKDIHQEYASKPNRKRQCRTCDKIMCANIVTLVSHYMDCNGTKSYENNGDETIAPENNDDREELDGVNSVVHDLYLDSIASTNGEEANKIVKKIKSLKQKRITAYTVPKLLQHQQQFGAWFADPRMMEEEYEASEERQAIRYYKMIFGDEFWTETGRVLYAEFRGKTGAFQECIPLSESDTGERAYGWWLRYRKMRNVGRFARKMGQLMRAVGSNSVTERSNNPYKTTQTGMRGSV
eukprot:47467_1